MSRNYILQFREDEQSAILLITNPDMRVKLQATCLYSYDGLNWINTAGGRTERTSVVSRTLKLTKTDKTKIKRFFNKVKRAKKKKIKQSQK